MKKIVLTEEQIRKIMDEMAYPTTFNMDEFKSLPSFASRIRYCQSRLQRLSSGSSRIVYKIDDEKVLKLAKNQKGIAQNEAEGGDYYKNSIGCFAEIYDVDDNFLWIEMQLARKAKVSDFKRITGYGWDVVCEWIKCCKSHYSRYGAYNHEYDKIFDSDEFQEQLENYSLFYSLEEYLGNYQLESIGDLLRLNSWGVVIDEYGNENIVIIDSGLSDNVWNDYYKGNNGFLIRA